MSACMQKLRLIESTCAMPLQDPLSRHAGQSTFNFVLAIPFPTSTCKGNHLATCHQLSRPCGATGSLGCLRGPAEAANRFGSSSSR